ncbi:MAG: hypothetical protein COW56_12075, partial [Rhodocyclales bacterium CG17_big_fil_post_rev_8_21_14_2_50_68_7]
RHGEAPALTLLAATAALLALGFVESFLDAPRLALVLLLLLLAGAGAEAVSDGPARPRSPPRA